MSAFILRNIKSGFATCKLFLLNPDRVLRTLVKPPELTTSEAEKLMVRTYQPAESCQSQDAVPHSPKTLVSEEGLASLQNLIFQQQASHAVDKTSR